jgi:voltage-gated potassium channel
MSRLNLAGLGRPLLLAALILTIPAFYLVLSGTPAPYRAGGRWLYALVAGLLFIDLWINRLDEKRGRMNATSLVDIVILAGAAASALTGNTQWHDAEWLARLIYCAIVFLRLAMLMGSYVKPHRLVHIVILALVLLALAGGGFWLIEPTVKSYPEGLWLAFLTAATLGYGDLMPSTPASRIFSVFIVLLGYALFSVVTASIAAILIGEDEKQLRRELHADARLLRTEIAALRLELPQLLAQAEQARQNNPPQDNPSQEKS